MTGAMSDAEYLEITELVAKANRLLGGLSGDANAALASRARAILDSHPSLARLRSVVAALEAANRGIRTLAEMTASIKARGTKSEGASASEEDCPEGFVKDPDTGECIEESRGTRPESFAKMKLARDLQRLQSGAPNAVSTLRSVRDELALHRKMLGDFILLAALSRPVPEPEGRVLRRQLDEMLRKGRR